MTPDQSLLVAIGRLEGKLDAIVHHQQSLEDRMIAHDLRLRELENSKSALYGVAAFIGSLTAGAVSLIAYMLRG